MHPLTMWKFWESSRQAQNAVQERTDAIKCVSVHLGEYQVKNWKHHLLLHMKEMGSAWASGTREGKGIAS